MNRNTYRVALLAFLISLVALTQVCSQVSAQPQDYKKWGRIAVDVVKLDYTDGEVSDYQYKGRKEISETQAQDTFELKVKEEGSTKDVNVYVTFNPKTNSLVTVTIEEIK